MRKVGLLCTVLLGANAVLAQSQDALSTGGLAQPSGSARTYTDEDSLFAEVYSVTGGRSGEDCPTGFLYGQVFGQDVDPTCANFYYSDLNFCSGGCQRVRYENFPPPGVTVSPIGVLSWRGCYLDGNTSGCDKPGAEFRVRFYPVATGGGPDPNTPYPYELHVPTRVDTGDRGNFGGAVPAVIWRFTIVLDNPVDLAAGWFGLSCATGLGNCVFLWEGCGEGDSVIYEDWESDGWNPAQRAGMECLGLNYCAAEKKIGACCDDCSGTCTDNATIFYCEGIGGRFVQDTACSAISPPCGDELGACCHDDGTCTPQVKCFDCQGGATPPCVGDMNCDGSINFRDINPFVLYLSNPLPVWQAAFPGCNPVNGDINCDGTWGQGSFKDINPFVALITTCAVGGPNGCPCPGPIDCGSPRTQGDVWGGWNSVCDPNNPADPYDSTAPLKQCCAIVPAGAQENEPDDCATPDTFNGGCDFAGDHFTDILCGHTIFGESGTASGHRDTDWYRVTTTSDQSFTVTVEAEFDVAVYGYRAGPSSPCTEFRDIATAVRPTLVFGEPGHNACTPVVLATRCLPAGTYFFVVAPAYADGVICGSDYKITVVCASCTPCAPPACPPSGAHSHQETDPNDPNQPLYCYDNPATPDPNGGCNRLPVDPANFEALPQTPTDPNDSFTFCGRLWATDGFRDVDWYKVEIALRAQVTWTVDTQVPIRASLLFWDAGGGTYIAPPADCSGYYYWVDTLYTPCVQGAWTVTANYEAGTYWFLVAPEDAAGLVFYGYPCPMDGVDLGNEYQITMLVKSVWCDSEILAKPHVATEDPGDPPCPTPADYLDNYNSGCDDVDPNAPADPMLTLGFDSANGWISQSGTWYTDPNDPNTFKKDYDWYKFSLTGNRRFRVYLYSNFEATWEIFDPNDPNAPGVGCDKGPTEGLAIPACHDQGEWTRRCYVGSVASPREYWLRVFPTGRVACGYHYWIALTEPTACSVCNWTCTGTTLDDPCDDVTDYDTNAGCDDPNAPPPHFMTFTCGATFCGRSYAKIYPNGSGYYDPEWFQLTQTNTNNRRIKLTVTAEFLAHTEVFASCADYDNANPLPGLDSITSLSGSTACPAALLTSTDSYAPGTTVYGRITMVDQFGDLLTNYYPCVKGYNRWKVKVECIV